MLLSFDQSSLHPIIRQSETDMSRLGIEPWLPTSQAGSEALYQFIKAIYQVIYQEFEQLFKNDRAFIFSRISVNIL
jgi:hypothetical protein